VFIMHPMRNMPNYFAVAFLALAFFCVGAPAVSAAECFPHCDYTHYYGPFDFTYIQPGLFGYPRCNAQGNCSPQLAYSATGFRPGRITVRFPRVKAIRRHP